MKDVELVPLIIDSVDFLNNTVEGGTLPSRDVIVNAGNELNGDSVTVGANVAGNWTADFNPFDVTPAMGVEARVADADGDMTQVDPRRASARSAVR